MFLIKSTYFDLKSIKRSILINPNVDYSIEKGRFISKIDQNLVEFEPNLPNLPIFGLFRFKFDQFLIKFDFSHSEFELRFEFGPRSQIKIVAMIDRTAGIESKIGLNRIQI